jgi:hypothetical protein
MLFDSCNSANVIRNIQRKDEEFWGMGKQLYIDLPIDKASKLWQPHRLCKKWGNGKLLLPVGCIPASTVSETDCNNYANFYSLSPSAGLINGL